jgi:hypothetical protein
MTMIEQFADLSLVATSDSGFVDHLGGVYGKAVAEKILAAFSEVDGVSTIAEPDDFARVAAEAGARSWHGGIAAAHELHRRGPGAYAASVLQLTLGFAQIGLHGRFEIALPYSDWFVLGPNRIQCTGSVSVDARPGRIVVSCAEEEFVFADLDGIWRPEEDDDPSVGWSRNRSYVLCSGYRVDPAVILPGDSVLDTALIPAAHGSINAAIGYLEEAGAPFVQWSSRLIAQLTLVGSYDGACLSSRSLSTRTGNVEIAVPGNEQHLAELLVHEAAHQHYYLAQLFSPLVTPEAAELRLYSAINGRYRPLDRVALAYHAVVNIFALLDALHTAGSSIARDSRLRMDELSGTEDSLRRTLVEHEHMLTDFGREFCGRMIRAGEEMIARNGIEPVEAARGTVRGVA